MTARRVPVQGTGNYHLPAHHPKRTGLVMPPGTVKWSERAEAWEAYRARYGDSQSIERIAERGGFSYGELVLFLGHNPTTWEAR